MAYPSAIALWGVMSSYAACPSEIQRLSLRIVDFSVNFLDSGRCHRGDRFDSSRPNPAVRLMMATVRFVDQKGEHFAGESVHLDSIPDEATTYES
ncbi:hypothetical protein [Granulosicoccus antarcticus]|uniref:Uncharacterized protein n=1 Tax=Granulosicoccus antarcticus IMCC3135 TaxID=1192854 RepID=A0A2Z2P0V3_9GAMM|nr:hypothetical protein [Granulosicoccus antarcticus]ASJ73887.1 hypothetical protein IMCC3135_19040 [Granulosicoccus antarcticus IMCC3135]